MSGLGSWTRDSANILGRVEPGRHGEPLPRPYGVLDLCLRDQPDVSRRSSRAFFRLCSDCWPSCARTTGSPGSTRTTKNSAVISSHEEVLTKSKRTLQCHTATQSDEARLFDAAVRPESRQGFSPACPGPSPGWRHTAHPSGLTSDHLRRAGGQLL